MSGGQQVGVWNGNSIPTFYNGVTFRSRTEARWAVFMDHLGVRWFYEHEGFELTSGRYVPDFWLPDLKRWLEIKPISFQSDASGYEQKRISEFSKLLTSFKEQITFCGAPAEQDDEAHWYENEGGYPGGGDIHYLWCRCPKCGALGIEFDGRGARVCGARCCPDDDKCYTYDDPLIEAAKKTSAQWRFH